MFERNSIERPEARNAVADVAGSLHAMSGPASKNYFTAKKAVGSKHRIGDLGEAALLEYAQARNQMSVVIALSLLCALPVDVVERAMLASDKEAVLILAKALDLSWATTWRCCPGAPDYRIATKDLDAMKGIRLAGCRDVQQGAAGLSFAQESAGSSLTPVLNFIRSDWRGWFD